MLHSANRPGMLVPLLAGICTAMLTQPAGGWWLDSGRGATLTLTAFFLVAIVVALAPHGSRSRRAAALWLGAMAGLAACLWWIGPGAIWPIVLIVAAVIAAFAIAAGSAVGWLCRS